MASRQAPNGTTSHMNLPSSDGSDQPLFSHEIDSDFDSDDSTPPPIPTPSSSNNGSRASPLPNGQPSIALAGYKREPSPASNTKTTAGSQPPTPGAPRRISSFAQPRPPGTPRTPNRVRFQDDDAPPSYDAHTIHQRSDPHWIQEEDGDWQESAAGRRESITEHRQPLLTSIQAPSVTVATDDFNPEDHLENARPRSNMRSAFMNMANSIIGAGIIGQPYAFRQAGLITGIILLIGLTIIVDWTIRLIVVNSKLSGANSFQATVEKCFGKAGLIAISLAQWAFAFGGMIAFCIIVGDTIPHVMTALFPSLETMHFLWLLTNRRFVIVLFIGVISFPLSLYRDIAKLAKASTLALISMLVIVVTVITQGWRVPPDMKGQLRGSLLINDGVFQAIGVISFAFVCHHNSLLIYGSLKKPTLDRFARVTHLSTTISMLACLLMALSGYLTFGDKTQGNLLNNFPSNNMLVNIARFCFGLNMLTTLPLECFVCREVMVLYWWPDGQFDKRRHLWLTSGLVVASVAISLLTCDLGIVFELVGATSACALAYILPPLCYLKLSSNKGWERIAAVACVVFGGIVMAISVVLALVKVVKGEGGGGSCG